MIEKQNQEPETVTAEKPKKNPLKGSGWRKISSAEDLEKSIVTMLNKILMSKDPLSHAGRFASLANSWINAERLKLEAGEWKELKERVDKLTEDMKDGQGNRY